MIESIWIKDSAAANPNCFNAPESVALQPGQSALLTGTVTIPSASSLDIGSCTSWFVTARGRTISTIASESTIGSGSGNGACAAIIFGISGANTASPFDLSKPLGGTGGIAAFAQLTTGITTANANDFIIASLGVQNGFNKGASTNTIVVNNQPSYNMVGAQVDASYSRCTADAYYIASNANFYTDPSVAWSSNYKGTWGLILDAVKKGSSGGTYSSTALPTSSLPAGPCYIKAEFAGDSNHYASSSTINGSDYELNVLPEYLVGGALAAIAACLGGFVVFKKRSSLPHLRLHI